MEDMTTKEILASHNCEIDCIHRVEKDGGIAVRLTLLDDKGWEQKKLGMPFGNTTTRLEKGKPQYLDTIMYQIESQRFGTEKVWITGGDFNEIYVLFDITDKQKETDILG